MKQYITLIFFIILASGALIFHFNNKGITKVYPVPTNGTMVKTDMEEKGNKGKRQVWMEALHRAAPGVDWREVEYNTAMEKQEDEKKNSKLESRFGNEIEEFAEGYLSGKWTERGSNNQAGSVFDIEYDVETNMMYLVSAGGSLFKTDFYFQYWEVVNDKFKFSPGLLKLVEKENGEKRMLALINKRPHYSDDMGLTWTSASAYEADNWGQVKDAFMVEKDGSTRIFLLAKSSYWSDFHLYVSTDLGENYTDIHTIYTHNSNNVAMAHVEGTGDIFVIEQIEENTSYLHRYNWDTATFELTQSASPLAFGEDGRGNLAAVINEDEHLSLYAYNGQEELYESQDTGKTWTFLSTLPIRPWEVRLYVSNEHPDVMLIGGVECYRSLDGGESWELINFWWEYYDDVDNKLHADIMEFDEFFDQNGDHFMTISNHGGLSITYDKSISNTNIGLYDLNVCQYYSVRTSPKNPKLVIAGSQDQGLQRGLVQGQGTVPFEQVISGDYGHNVFTKGGDAFWTVYPGGWVSHYSDPAQGYLDASWEVNSDNETVWIPPLVEGPDLDKDQVLLAGGNLNGGGGSHLIKLTYEFGAIQKEQYSFDFHDATNSEISAIGISPINRDLFYVATNNGKLYYSTDGGQNFSKSHNNVSGSHYLYGACILPSRLDPSIVYISGSGYSTAGVVKSPNGGKHFVSMDKGLPNTMVFAIATNEDESLFFAATEAGPYVYVTEKDEWFALSGTFAPTQSYWTVEYLPDSKVARFGTYGRGIWDFEVIESGVSNEDLVSSRNEMISYPNPVNDFLTVQFEDPLNDNALINFYTLSGQLAKRISIVGGKSVYDIDLTQLEKGMYVLTVEGEAFSYRRKVIKN